MPEESISMIATASSLQHMLEGTHIPWKCYLLFKMFNIFTVYIISASTSCLLILNYFYNFGSYLPERNVLHIMLTMLVKIIIIMMSMLVIIWNDDDKDNDLLEYFWLFHPGSASQTILIVECERDINR